MTEVSISDAPQWTKRSDEIIYHFYRNYDRRDPLSATPIPLCKYRSTAKCWTSNETHKEPSRSVDFLPGSTIAAVIDSPSLYHVFPEQQRCVGVYAILSTLFSFFRPKLQALQSRLLSNNANRTTKVYWISWNIGQMGGGGVWSQCLCPKCTEHEINIPLGKEL